MKLLDYVDQAVKLSAEISKDRPGMAASEALILAAQYVLATTTKPSKRSKLSDEDTQKIAEWVATNEFPPLTCATIFSHATAREATASDATHTGILLTELGVPKTGVKGHPRYYRAK